MYLARIIDSSLISKCACINGLDCWAVSMKKKITKEGYTKDYRVHYSVK